MPNIKPDEFAKTVNKVLGDYYEEITDKTEKSIVDISTQSAVDLKQENKGANTWMKYPKGWTFKIEKKRWTIEGIVYNKTKYRLTHLLENGHVLARGGRIIGDTHAFQHIYDINEKAQKKLEEEMMKL